MLIFFFVCLLSFVIFLNYIISFCSSLFLKHGYGVGYTLTLAKVWSLEIFSYLMSDSFRLFQYEFSIPWSRFIALLFNDQTAPSTSVAADIVGHHVPGAMLLSDVCFSPSSCASFSPGVFLSYKFLCTELTEDWIISWLSLACYYCL